MKQHIIPALRLTFASLILLSVIYTLSIWSVAQAAPNGGKGEIVTYNNKKQYVNIGQQFTDSKYFHSRPSAVDYDASGSGASNKAATDAQYLKLVQSRIDTLLANNSGLKTKDIPVDLITASASGLDPNISVQAAKIQIKRIADIRGISEISLQRLVESETEKPVLGLFGTEKINVLKINIALDKLK